MTSPAQHDNHGAIDWDKPIETLKGERCLLIERGTLDAGYPARVMFPGGELFWLEADGTWTSFGGVTYAVRNVAEQSA